MARGTTAGSVRSRHIVLQVLGPGWAAKAGPVIGPVLLSVLLVVTTPATGTAQVTNTVVNSGTLAYLINGASNPSLTLTRGVTYYFKVTASGHPFWIKTSAVTGTGSAYNTGVSNNGIQSGTLVFTVPTNAPSTLFYICQFHSAMKGTLNVINPPPPPIVRVVSLSLGASVVMTSTGASGWSPIPEYSYDLPSSNWSPVPSFTNNFLNGTNTTSFSRLDSPANPQVFLRMRNSKN